MDFPASTIEKISSDGISLRNATSRLRLGVPGTFSALSSDF
jgi:hypothetical protein